jgi:hypothetical protein
MVKKGYFLKIDDKLWKHLKIYCVENEITIADYVEELIKKGLNK